MAKSAAKKAGAPAAAKGKPTASATSHPTYFQMIKEAILALHERNGSSPYAIAKHMEKNHRGELPGNYRKLLAVQLRNLAGKGKLVKVKASFKLSPSEKHGGGKIEKVPAPKGKTKAVVKAKKLKNAPVSVLGKRKAGVALEKTAASDKPAKKAVMGKKVKKATPVKPKQKSVKSPAARKTAR